MLRTVAVCLLPLLFVPRLNAKGPIDEAERICAALKHQTDLFRKAYFTGKEAPDAACSVLPNQHMLAELRAAVQEMQRAPMLFEIYWPLVSYYSCHALEKGLGQCELLAGMPRTPSKPAPDIGNTPMTVCRNFYFTHRILQSAESAGKAALGYCMTHIRNMAKIGLIPNAAVARPFCQVLLRHWGDPAGACAEMNRAGIRLADGPEWESGCLLYNRMHMADPTICSNIARSETTNEEPAVENDGMDFKTCKSRAAFRKARKAGVKACGDSGLCRALLGASGACNSERAVLRGWYCARFKPAVDALRSMDKIIAQAETVLRAIAVGDPTRANLEEAIRTSRAIIKKASLE